jgi:glucose-1-phosphate thymidylyltransferase
MKWIVLAWWTWTRLYPLTVWVSKQMLPVYDKPMIYYPIATLMSAKINDILIISTPHDLPFFQKLLWDGSELWCVFSYVVQEKPSGIADAFIVWEHFILDSNVALILGDNIFYWSGMGKVLAEHKNIDWAMIFAYPVKDPERYWVVEFDEKGKVIAIEEKPTHPKSIYAVPGLYFYDNNVVKYAQQIKPSSRGEIEITDLNNLYLKAWKLFVTKLWRWTAWLDTWTIESLSQASEFVRSVQWMQWFKIWCIEEIAYSNWWIDKNQLCNLWKKYEKTEYWKYLMYIWSL